jgi:glutaredoxin
MAQELLFYMTAWCSSCHAAQDALTEWGVTARTINIGRDREAAARVRALTGFESVPTFVIVDGAGIDPIQPPSPLPAGRGPRGVDRGAVLTEPTNAELKAWLIKNSFLR